MSAILILLRTFMTHTDSLYAKVQRLTTDSLFVCKNDTVDLSNSALSVVIYLQCVILSCEGLD